MSYTYTGRRVVLLSGGVDSSTLLYYLCAYSGKDFSAYPIAVWYGQRHERELNSAINVVYQAREVFPGKVQELVVVEMSKEVNKIFGGSCLTKKDVPVPHGHYTDPSMESTVVPNRNMVLISLATAYAIAQNANTVYYAAHSGDRAIYPDCRPEFIEKLNDVVQYVSRGNVLLMAPFLYMNKRDIVLLGEEIERKTGIPVPYYLTWTCYEGGDTPCGECGACVERQEAFGYYENKRK